MSYRIIDIINSYLDNYLNDFELYSAYGTVLEVNDEFCTVEIEGKAPVERVRLQFPDGDFCIIPKQRSKVVITFISQTEAVLSLVEKIQKICLGSDSEIIFNKGSNGGLVLSEKVSEKLNKIIDDLNRLKDLIKNAPVSAGDGGATFKASLLPWAGLKLTKTSPKEIENKKIKQ